MRESYERKFKKDKKDHGALGGHQPVIDGI